MFANILRPLRNGLFGTALTLTGKGETLRALKELRAAERFTHDDVIRTESQQLRRLLSHCHHKVPYYRDLLNELGWSNTLDDCAVRRVFKSLPILTKELIRANFDQLRALDIDQRQWYYNTSGGSTGEPITFIQDETWRCWARAAKILFDEWAGHHPGGKKVVLWGSERDLLVGRETLRTYTARRLRNETCLNTFRATEAEKRKWLTVINRVKPALILSYVESAYELARLIERESLEVHAPNALMTSAGTLHPQMREVIERAFRAPVFDRYGSREVADVASQRDRSSPLFIHPRTHFVEVVDEAGQDVPAGDTGRLLITQFTNDAMPLLRYDIGDLGSFAPKLNSQTIQYRALSRVSGRTNSTIQTSTCAVDSAALTALLYFKRPNELFQSFSKYQLVQTARDEVEFRAELQDRIAWAHEKEIVCQKLALALGRQTKIVLREADLLAPSKSGKHIYIWSEIS